MSDPRYREDKAVGRLLQEPERRERLKLLWGWIKDGRLSLREFSELLPYADRGLDAGSCQSHAEQAPDPLEMRDYFPPESGERG